MVIGTDDLSLRWLRAAWWAKTILSMISGCWTLKLRIIKNYYIYNNQLPVMAIRYLKHENLPSTELIEKAIQFRAGKHEA